MDKIFVNVASYRDPELPKTVHDLISKAMWPERLRIVVYEQNDPEDPTVFGVYPVSQVLVLQTHFSLAKGPTVARARIQREYAGEEYYLQIDSHMRAIQNWDAELKHMLDLVPEPAVLTQYPPEYSLDSEQLNCDKVRSGLYIQGFGLKDRFTRIQSSLVQPVDRRYFPYTSKGWSACFSFSRGSIVGDAPYDPGLEHLFFGEELDITLKLFTRGYYFFSPHRSVFFTLFKRSHRRTYWQDIPSSKREPLELKSRVKLWDRILETRVGPNDLGTVRTVDDYMKFADIDSLANSRLTSRAKSFRIHSTRPLLR